MNPIKPTKVLCKRTLTSGKTFYWDDTVSQRHERDNRMLVEGNWYDVIESKNDSWNEEKRNFTFTIIDNQGNPHLFFMYGENDMLSWPDICTYYGPRDYAKWFYTPEELELLAQGKFKLKEDINIRPGNYHWVKSKDGKWVIALCVAENVRPGKFNWMVIGSQYHQMDEDFLEIGEQVVSQEKNKENLEKIQMQEDLLDEIFPLIDAINKEDPDKDYPSVQYVMQSVNKAVDNYMNKSFAGLSDFFDSE
jgi:hypothetical protein